MNHPRFTCCCCVSPGSKVRYEVFMAVAMDAIGMDAAQFDKRVQIYSEDGGCSFLRKDGNCIPTTRCHSQEFSIF
jgi:hypothetical protein